MFPIELFLLLAVLVLVPLALDEVEPRERPRSSAAVRRMAAFGAAASFGVATGPVAGSLAALWLAFTVHLALRELEHRRTDAVRTPVALATGAAFVFLPAGAFWHVLSRLGASPLGFREPVLLLTAIHFHYAAFVTLVLLALAGRFLAGRAYTAAVWGAIAGTPLVAVGITLSRTLELAGTLLLDLSIGTVSWLVLTRVVPRLRGPSRVLLSVSALSTIPSMLLAALYAWGRATDAPIVSLAQMAAVHGPLNAVGFGLCGLLGWRLVRPRHLAGPLL